MVLEFSAVSTDTGTTPKSPYRRPNFMYVAGLLNTLRVELQGWHTKVAEIEALKYFEDQIVLNKGEVVTGQKVRSGLTSELMEQVKGALLAGKPKVHFVGHRQGREASLNQSKREHYWQDKIDKMFGGDDAPNYISELLDSQLLGCGILKAAKDMSKWPKKAQYKKRGESSKDHIERVKAYKRKWGHPTSEVIVHPLTAYFRPGKGSRVEEIIEHGLKSKSSVYESYSLNTFGQEVVDKSQFQDIAAMPGQPDSYIRPMPMGMDSTQYVAVTEYWNPNCYQVYINQQLVYEELDEEVSVRYFIAPGRTSSSKDPDKWAVSIAEALRHNEPQINRLLTRMLEASELIVNKRLTLEVPESYTDPMEELEDGVSPKPKSFTFKDDSADALPAGAKVRDVYEGVEKIYEAMPLFNVLMSLAMSHGVSPLFKGISPGAAGSGYRDNSLYLMAKSLFNYIVVSTQRCLTAYVEWQEELLCYGIKTDVYSGQWSLKPSDVEDWPATITVELKPELPQNLIAEGEFWSRQEERGNVSKRYVREHGLNLEQPEEMEDEVDLEQLKELLKPMLAEQVISETLQPPPQNPATTGLVGPDGKTPIQSGGAGGPTPNPMGATSAGANGAGREIGQQMGGFATGGQGKQPSLQPGALPSGG